MASHVGVPCEVRTSTCRNFATISSGLCTSSHCSPPRWQSHTSSRTTSLGFDHRQDYYTAWSNRRFKSGARFGRDRHMLSTPIWPVPPGPPKF